MTDLTPLARRQRRAVLDVDADLARRLVDAYALAWRRLRPTLDVLTARIQAARDAGEEVSAGWLAREEQLRSLERQLVAEVTQIARSANGQISAAQWRAISLAEQHARAAIEAAAGDMVGVLPSFGLLPAEAVRDLVGRLGNGQPLAALLDELGPAASASAREAIASGVILGEGPGTIARRMRAAFGGNSVRALRVARTSVLQSYREANRASYAASGVVRAYRWLSAKSSRTCLACLARDGSEWPLNTPMPVHVSCRCTLVPILHAEFGPTPVGETGAQWFEKQSADTKRSMMSGVAFRALQAGEVALEDFAGTARAGRWGRQTYLRSVTQILGAERTRELISAARS